MIHMLLNKFIELSIPNRNSTVATAGVKQHNQYSKTEYLPHRFRRFDGRNELMENIVPQIFTGKEQCNKYQKNR